MSNAKNPRTRTQAVRFLQQFLQDREQGVQRTLEQYQALFPGFADVVASEYAALVAPTTAGDRRPVDYPAEGDRYQDPVTIGRGGMGVVQRVFDPSLQRFVAMKRLADAGLPAPHLLARFLREAQITARLHHPGIVAVFEIGLDAAQQPYYTMPLIEGQSLVQILGARSRGDDAWSLVRLLEVLVRVCDAIAYAHDRGVVHRDLKPSNIMVGRFGEAYVVDWGLAKAEALTEDEAAGPAPSAEPPPPAFLHPSTPQTMAGDILGTPAYMAPEQARGEAAGSGKPGDVYALGAILYHVLTGAAPYGSGGTGNGTGTTLDAVLAGPPPPLARAAPAAPPQLAAICDRAMARAPSRRYTSANELAADLRAYLENRVVRAYAAGPLAELRTWVRRNRGVALASAGALLALVAGLLASLHLKSVADHNAAASDQNFELAFAAAEELLAEVGLYTLEDEPGADPMREALAGKALVWFQRFAALRADDPRVADKVALSRFRVATLQSKLGRADAARDALAAARADTLRVIAANGGTDAGRHLLARIDVELDLIRMQRGELQDAIAGMRRSAEVLADLLSREPDSAELLRDRASLLHNLGLAASRQGDHAGSLRLADDKLIVSQRLAAIAADRPWAHEQLASAHQLRGTALWQLGRLDDATTALRAAAAVLEAALQKHPQHRGLRWRRSDVLNVAAVVLRHQEHLPEAAAALEQAIDTLRQLTAAHPGVRNYHGNLAGSLCNLAMIRAAAGERDGILDLHAEGLKQVRLALAIDPGNSRYRNYRRILGRELSTAHLAAGQHAEAAQAVRELVAEQPGQHAWLAGYQLAACATCCDRDATLAEGARLQRTQAYATEAMGHLQEAVQRGTAAPASFADASFDALRSRADFLALVASARGR